MRERERNHVRQGASGEKAVDEVRPSISRHRGFIAADAGRISGELVFYNRVSVEGM